MCTNLLWAYPKWWHVLDLPINRYEAQRLMEKCSATVNINIPVEQRPKLEHIKIIVDVDADLCDIDVLRNLRSETLQELTTAYDFLARLSNQGE